ncbi:extracellular solute-binding protein [Mesorhizobium sp. A623]
MIKRREAGIVAGLFAVLATPASAIAEPAKELVVVNAGGAYGDAVEECLNRPFEEKYNIKVTVQSPAGLAKLTGMVESGNITAGIIDLETGELERAKAMGLLDAIDWNEVKPFPMYADAKQPYGFGISYFSTIMVWRPDVKAPANWEEFFDVEKFPGMRSLPDYPGYVLPFAAIAAGVDRDAIFPLDLDKAFDVLNGIKDHVIWWQSGGQPPQLLQDNEVQYAISWSGRVVGDPAFNSSFKDGMLETAWWVVPKGASDAIKEAAWLYLHEASDPKTQACEAEMISYTGASTELDALLPQDRLAEFPTFSENRKVQFATDGKWWFDNAAEVEKRWQEFRLTQ